MLDARRVLDQGAGSGAAGGLAGGAAGSTPITEIQATAESGGGAAQRRLRA